MREVDGFAANPTMMGSMFIRRARKDHRCNGGHDGDRRTTCPQPIVAGDLYVEYIGETSPYQSGNRYHAECAEQQGLLIRRQQ